MTLQKSDRMSVINTTGWAISICILIVGWFLSKYLIQKMIAIFNWKVNWDRKCRIKCLKLCQKDVTLMIKNSNCNPIMLRLAWSDAGIYLFQFFRSLTEIFLLSFVINLSFCAAIKKLDIP